MAMANSPRMPMSTWGDASAGAGLLGIYGNALADKGGLPGANLTKAWAAYTATGVVAGLGLEWARLLELCLEKHCVNNSYRPPSKPLY
jgi:hypothetical protein